MNIIYHILKGIIKLHALLPMPVLYFFAKGWYFIAYKVFAYRLSVVRKNLNIVFPEKSDEERKKIERQFYHYFFDFIAEMIKAFSLSKKDLSKFAVVDEDLKALLADLYDKHDRVFFVSPHYGNWEIAGYATQVYLPFQVNSIYQKLNNFLFEKLVYYMRTRFGSEMFPKGQAFRKIYAERRKSITGFIADQNANKKSAHWAPFFGYETPFFTGVEVIAKKMNVPVVFVYADRDEKRLTTVRGELLTASPKEMAENELVELFIAKLTELIRMKPQYWLWSHNRWKRSRKIEESANSAI